jgi:hypothetical protein
MRIHLLVLIISSCCGSKSSTGFWCLQHDAVANMCVVKSSLQTVTEGLPVFGRIK